MARTLDDISTERPLSAALRAVIYGTSKIGKSTLGADAPSPIFICTEDGLAGLPHVPAFPVATDLTEHVYSAISLLANESHEYKTVVIDSLDWLEPLLWAKVCNDHGWKSIEQPGYGKGYVEAAREWRHFLDGCDALIRKGMNVLLICHDQIKRVDLPTADGYDSHVLKLHNKAAGVVQEWADVIGFCTQRITTRKSDAGFGNTKTKAVGTGERILRLEANPAHCAGNRFGLQDTALSWGDFSAALNAATTNQEGTTHEN